MHGGRDGLQAACAAAAESRAPAGVSWCPRAFEVAVLRPMLDPRGGRSPRGGGLRAQKARRVSPLRSAISNRVLHAPTVARSFRLLCRGCGSPDGGGRGRQSDLARDQLAIDATAGDAAAGGAMAPDARHAVAAIGLGQGFAALERIACETSGIEVHTHGFPACACGTRFAEAVGFVVHMSGSPARGCVALIARLRVRWPGLVRGQRRPLSLRQPRQSAAGQGHSLRLRTTSGVQRRVDSARSIELHMAARALALAAQEVAAPDRIGMRGCRPVP